MPIWGMFYVFCVSTTSPPAAPSLEHQERVKKGVFSTTTSPSLPHSLKHQEHTRNIIFLVFGILPFHTPSNTDNAPETARFWCLMTSPSTYPLEHQEHAQNSTFLCLLIPFLSPLSSPQSSLSPLSPLHSFSLSLSLYPLSFFPLLPLSPPPTLSFLCVLSLPLLRLTPTNTELLGQAYQLSFGMSRD